MKRLVLILGLAMATVFVPSEASAASITSPENNAVVTDTRRPTFAVTMDTAPTVSGKAHESNPLIRVYGTGFPRGGGALCLPAATAVSTQFSCSAPYDFEDGIYLVSLEYQRDDCFTTDPLLAPWGCGLVPVVETAYFLTIKYQKPVRPPPPTKVDVRVPTLAAARGVLDGSKAVVSVRATDDSAQVILTVGIFDRRHRKIMIKNFRADTSDGGGTFDMTLRLPSRTLLKPLTYCIGAMDAAEHQSRVVCGRLRPKP